MNRRGRNCILRYMAALLLFAGCLFGGNKTTVEYHLYYQGLPGGHAILSRSETAEGLRLDLKLRTNMVMDRFFRIRDTITVIADSETFDLIRQEKATHEGKYNDTRTFRVSDIPRDSLINPIRNEFCAILMLMDPQYFRAKQLDLNLFSKGREIPFSLQEKYRENLTVDGSSRQCILYEPTDDSLANIGKEDARLSVWMLNDQPSFPVQMRLEFKYGTIILKYRERR